MPCSLHGHESRLVGLQRVLHSVASFERCGEVVSSYKQALRRIKYFFIGVAFKRVLPFPFSDHSTPGVFCVLWVQNTCRCLCVMCKLPPLVLLFWLFFLRLFLPSFFYKSLTVLAKVADMSHTPRASPRRSMTLLFTILGTAHW